MNYDHLRKYFKLRDVKGCQGPSFQAIPVAGRSLTLYHTGQHRSQRQHGRQGRAHGQKSALVKRGSNEATMYRRFDRTYIPKIWISWDLIASVIDEEGQKGCLLSRVDCQETLF